MYNFTTSSVFPFPYSVLFYRFAFFLWKHEPRLDSISLRSRWWPWISRITGINSPASFALCHVYVVLMPGLRALCLLCKPSVNWTTFLASALSWTATSLTIHYHPVLYLGQSITWSSLPKSIQSMTTAKTSNFKAYVTLSQVFSTVQAPQLQGNKLHQSIPT